MCCLPDLLPTVCCQQRQQLPTACCRHPVLQVSPPADHGQEFPHVDCMAITCTSAGARRPGKRDPLRRAATQDLQKSIRQGGPAHTMLVSPRLKNLQGSDCSTFRAGCRWYLAEARLRSQPSHLLTDHAPIALEQGQSHRNKPSPATPDCLTNLCAQSCHPKATQRCCS